MEKSVLDGLRNRLRLARSSDPAPGFRAAAVLVPLIVRRDRVSVLFTQRTESLPTHPGQISFPGGKIDPTDRDAVAAALREAEEEVAIPEARVEILGALTPILVPSRFQIAPVVGVVDGTDLLLKPAQAEVAEVFEFGLSELLDPGVFVDLGPVERDGRVYPLCAYRLAGRDIWGATARILRELLDLVSDAQT